MQVVKYDVRCPRWALPREEVPIQTKIERTVTADISRIVLDLPPCLRLVDTINVLDHSVSGGHLSIREIDRVRLSEYDYFGVIVATREPFEDLKREVPVKTSFHMRDGTLETLVTPVRVFRPRLEFAKAPDILTLTDDESGVRSIPIRLKFAGFGDVFVRCKCTIGGHLASRHSSLVDEILQRLVHDDGLYSDAIGHFEPSVRVDSAQVQRIADEFRDKILSDGPIRKMLNAGKIDASTAAMLHELADSDKKNIMNHLHKTMPTVVINIVSDILSRTIGENLQLESKTTVVTPVKLPVGELLVKFQYRDAVGNQYPTIHKTIKIEDRRRAKDGAGLEIPLVVTADESEAYKNVEEMQLGYDDYNRH